MGERPTIEIVRGDDESVCIFIAGREVAHASHDADGFNGMRKIVETVTDVAKALGAVVVDASEPGPQPWRYFVTYQTVSTQRWWQFWSVVTNPGQVQSSRWFDLDGEINSDEDTERIAEHIAAGFSYPVIVTITGFTCTDGPY